MSIKLAILGILMEKECHPYEISQIMKDREMHTYMNIQYGSLYYAIEKLNKEQLVEKVETVSGDGRPDKTVYRITDKGKEQFGELLLEEMKKPGKLQHPVYAALGFVKYGDQDHIKKIIERRIRAFEKETERMWNLYEEHVGMASKAVLHILWGGYSHALTELNWLKSLYEDIVNGRLTEIGPSLDVQKGEIQKKRFHRP